MKYPASFWHYSNLYALTTFSFILIYFITKLLYTFTFIKCYYYVDTIVSEIWCFILNRGNRFNEKKIVFFDWTDHELIFGLNCFLELHMSFVKYHGHGR